MRNIIKNYSKNLIHFFSYAIRSLLNSFNERAVYYFFEALRKSSQKNPNSQLLTEFKIYPKKPKRLFPVIPEIKDTFIILQGPILDQSFVQDSVDWYRSCGIENIIVSTNDSNIKINKVEVVTVPKSSIKGLGNENNHIRTTRSALDQIPEDKLVIKTRSDMRIYSELALANIPLKHNQYLSTKTLDGKRLGCISNNSVISKINNISDHFYVARCSQLRKMFSLNEREINATLKEIDLNDDNLFRRPSDGTWMMKSIKGTYIYTEFYGEQFLFNSFRKNCLKNDFSEKRILNKLDYIDSLSRYIQIIKDCIYIVDPDELDLYWLKKNISTLPSDYNNKYQNPKPLAGMRLTSLNWLSLIYDDKYEEKIFKFLDSLDDDEPLF